MPNQVVYSTTAPSTTVRLRYTILCLLKMASIDNWCKGTRPFVGFFPELLFVSFLYSLPRLTPAFWGIAFGAKLDLT